MDKELSILDKAFTFAAEAHAGQTRKGTAIPYILHPLEAAAIVATMTADLEVIAAAALHDVVEDCGVSLAGIEALFGTAVAGLVAAQSEYKRVDRPAVDTWKARKQETLYKLAGLSTLAKMVTLGDKLSNLRAVRRDFDALGDALWQRFNESAARSTAGTTAGSRGSSASFHAVAPTASTSRCSTRYFPTDGRRAAGGRLPLQRAAPAWRMLHGRRIRRSKNAAVRQRAPRAADAGHYGAIERVPPSIYEAEDNIVWKPPDRLLVRRLALSAPARESFNP